MAEQVRLGDMCPHSPACKQRPRSSLIQKGPFQRKMVRWLYQRLGEPPKRGGAVLGEGEAGSVGCVALTPSASGLSPEVLCLLGASVTCRGWRCP